MFKLWHCKNKIADENTLLKPKSLYANTKVEIEKIKKLNNIIFHGVF